MHKRNFVVLFSVLLASCSGLSFKPGSATNPLKSSVGSPPAVEQNSEVFISTSGPLTAVSLSQRDEALEDSVSSVNPVVGNKGSKSVYWVKVKDVIAEPGITVELSNQTATREIIEVGKTSYRFRDDLELNFKVKVASNVPVGKQFILVRMVNISDGSKVGVANLAFDIVKPAQ
jgi:hypothetical protein